jgi:hypothetical protein
MNRYVPIARTLPASIFLSCAGLYFYEHSYGEAAADEGAPGRSAAGPERADPADQASTGPFEDTEWAALAPRNWAPAKTFDDDVARLSDADPRAMDALVNLRAAWANAPAEAAMDGKPIRVGGYLVPLDSDDDAVTEFLLVPYFGACIHAPPPANQVIHVVPRHPVLEIDDESGETWPRLAQAPVNHQV